jgi:hypothetical protein
LDCRAERRDGGVVVLVSKYLPGGRRVANQQVDRSERMDGTMSKFSVGDRVFNHCVKDSGTITGLHPHDSDLFLFDGIDYFHEVWLDPINVVAGDLEAEKKDEQD